MSPFLINKYKPAEKEVRRAYKITENTFCTVVKSHKPSGTKRLISPTSRLTPVSWEGFLELLQPLGLGTGAQGGCWWQRHWNPWKTNSRKRLQVISRPATPKPAHIPKGLFAKYKYFLKHREREAIFKHKGHNSSTLSLLKVWLRNFHLGFAPCTSQPSHVNRNIFTLAKA